MRLICWLLLSFCATGSSFADPDFINKHTNIVWHADSRKTPKIVSEPLSPKLHSASEVLAYLSDHHKIFQLPAGVQNLVHSRTSESLRGKHYHFQQIANGLKISNAELIVSVDHENSQIYTIFNNTFPDQLPKIRALSLISRERALDIAWQSLKVHGALMDPLGVSLEYRDIDGSLKLVFVTHIAVQAPFGHFEHVIDATSGKILAKFDAAISRNKRSAWPSSIDSYTGPIWDRKQTQAQQGKKYFDAMRDPGEEVSAPVDGQALLFDPDPRTTLKDRTLNDDSPAEKFEGAYLNRTLKDLSFDGTHYTLQGPWVKVLDFESPHVVPSTTPDGHWNAKRGDNAFNDAMTYFHLDQSQRYIQFLGFSGPRGIQFGSISADSDGLNGDDNSHYIPYSNRIAFGHGCVDDNQDADVILHEYGHAMQNSINSNWNGGDTGAMGEGFGDYWAASYSLSTLNGSEYYPNEVFSWDGHGINNPCWPGRVLDALGAHYDDDTRYDAHTQIDGGFQSDELWSTPLFQSLLALRILGIPREEVDRIVLESHFGLGSGVTMREMANNIVRTAQALYPNGPHAGVFTQNFIHHNIIEVPQAVLTAAALKVENAGSNGFADPGETINIFIPLLNQGTLAAGQVHAELSSSSAGVQIINNSADYGDVAIGEQRTSSSPFVVALSPDLGCGAPANFTLILRSAGMAIRETFLSFSLPLGAPWPNPNLFSAIANMPIPDNNPKGAVSILTIANSGATIKPSGFSVDLNLTHSYTGDLAITLISPKGTRVSLHKNTGGADDDIKGNYPSTLTPAESFNKLDQEPLDGDWKLEVIDSARLDLGQLNSWGIRADFERRCE